jgi:hypothetical protein
LLHPFNVHQCGSIEIAKSTSVEVPGIARRSKRQTQHFYLRKQMFVNKKYKHKAISLSLATIQSLPSQAKIQ